MALTDVAVRNAKASPEGKDIKLSDAGGLHLLIKPTGAKYWRLNYRFMGKQKTLGLGVYPEVKLADARAKRDDAKRLLADGTDPSFQRQITKAASKEASANSFEAVAKEWFTKKRQGWTDSTASRIIASFEADLFPYIGKRPISEIKAPELLAALLRIEARGSIDTAHRVKQRAGEVFRYAIATHRAERDPTPDLKDALSKVKQTRFPFIKDPKRIGELLRAIDAYQGTPAVCAAMKLAPLVFLRPGNLRAAEWSDISLDDAVWRIPGEKMKTRNDHIVPLSRQAVAILRDIQLLTGNGRYVFPSARGGGRPMSDNAILVALRTMGFPKEEMTGHGFRHMASTRLNEMNWPKDWIETQLAHTDRTTRGVYNAAEYLDDRARMMQAWSDYLDGLRTGAEVISIGRKA